MKLWEGDVVGGVAMEVRSSVSDTLCGSGALDIHV